ncbi:TorF family putative porin [Thioalkalivibrio sp. ALJT]|uniref:TorF family putative porin n=1 Tax=Thioalkalivibrio sp. ALJT TaxID=1158146 RepID=UPI0003A1281B|nr:TorF family putative porin [Thioalkalivibrio sp. ALJT]
MKKFTRSALAAAVLTVGSTGGVAFTSTAAAELSVNIGAVSNYYFRGLSETDNAAAIQGGIDFEHESGFYVGTWASNVDFGDDTTYELDLYLGFADELASGFGYDVGYIQYLYPDADDDLDFGEIYGELSYDMFYGGLAYTAYVEDSDASTGDVYYYLGLDVPFMDVYSAGFLVGYTDFEESGVNGYTHYMASLARDAGDFGEFSFNLEYATGTSEFDEENDAGDVKAWVGWSTTF